MSALKENTMYIFEMADRKKILPKHAYKKYSEIDNLSISRYLGNKQQMIEIKDRILEYKNHLPRYKSLCEQYYVDYIEKLYKGDNIYTEFYLGDSHKSRRIYECEVLHETELTHIENKCLCDICSNDYNDVQFKSVDYKFIYVKYKNRNEDDCFARFIYFKFKDLVVDYGSNDKKDKIIEENIKFLNLINEGNMKDIYKVLPYCIGFSKEKLIHTFSKELKLLLERYQVLTNEGAIGVVNLEYDKEFISTPSDAKSTIETFVLKEESYFSNLEELENDIKKPREINFANAFEDLISQDYQILFNLRKKKENYA